MEIGLFGRVTIRRNSTTFAGFPTRKVAELLALLALNAGRSVNRKDAIAMMWHGSDGPKASNRLSATLYLLRKSLEDEFGDDATELFGTGDGSIWLTESATVDVERAEANWINFSNSVDAEAKRRSSVAVSQMYRGHLCTELHGTWFEPMQSLWAARWTECSLWLARDNPKELDRILAQMTKIHPVLPVTKNLVIKALAEMDREDLSQAWQKTIHPHSYARPESQKDVHAGAHDLVHDSVAFELPTVTFLLLRTGKSELVQSLAEKCRSTVQELHDGGFALTAPNPIAARLVAAEVRSHDPFASIYISTRVHRPDGQLPGHVAERYSQIQAGEILMNASAASLVEQHQANIILEHKVGRAEYKLI